MTLTTSPTELTTSATDALLAIECAMLAAWVWRERSGRRRKAGLWCGVFALTTVAALLGAVAHGIVLPPLTLAILWKLLYLCLGLLVALFLTGAVHDWRGQVAATRFLPWGLGAGVAFFGMTELCLGSFLVFVVFETAAMTTALAIYARLAADRRLPGAGVVALASLLHLVAAAVQASDLAIRSLDHNGLFHLVQMAASATLALGLRLGLQPVARSGGTGAKTRYTCFG